MKYLSLLALLLSFNALAGGYEGLDMPKGTYAVTFDDGPVDRTLTILNELDRQHVKATFFVVSDMAQERPWLVREEIARGHVIGCHSVNHPLMTRLKPEQWKRQIDECVRVVEKITKTKIELFRFPYGESTWEQEEYVKSKGMKVILWNIDSLDWKKGPKEELRHLKWGINKEGRGIILMHDIQKSTATELGDILRYLKSKKARLVRLSKSGCYSLCKLDKARTNKIHHQKNKRH